MTSTLAVQPEATSTPRPRRLVAGIATALFLATGMAVAAQIPFVKAEATTGSPQIFWEREDMEAAIASGEIGHTDPDLIVPAVGTAAGVALGALLIPVGRRRDQEDPTHP